MEALTKTAWFALAALHILPAMVAVRPRLVSTLYCLEPGGDIGVLLVHRGVLFACICAAAIWAAFDPGVRRLAGLVVSISVIGFLLVYWRAGGPPGALRRIAVMDAVGLVPLAFVLWRAWAS